MNTAQKIIVAVSIPLIFLAAFFSLGKKSNPLSIEELEKGSYPGSDIKIEESLSTKSTYGRYIVSYTSDSLKIYALLLIPNSEKPKDGFPVIILNHGYIIPEKYTPDGNYIPYMDAFARAGYIVFKPDFRGHGKSDGKPTSVYFASDYVIDNLNAVSSIKKYPDVNPNKIGVWGHSMGGNIALKTALIDKNIKAVSIWSGVVAPINDIIYNWQNRVSYKPDTEDLILRNQNLDYLLKKYGTPSQNPDFWDSIDPNTYLNNIQIPVQIEVGLADNQVPPDFSEGLYEKLESLGKNVEYYKYPGANHDINQSFSAAMEKTLDFFNKYLK